MDAVGDGEDRGSGAWGEGRDEAPHEPNSEQSMHVLQLGVSGDCCIGLLFKENTFAIRVDSVPGFFVWVVESEDAEVDDKSYLSGTTSERAQA